jgi:hypothetical protein
MNRKIKFQNPKGLQSKAKQHARQISDRVAILLVLI